MLRSKKGEVYSVTCARLGNRKNRWWLKTGHQNFRRIEIVDFGVKFLKEVVLKIFGQMCSDEFFLKHALAWTWFFWTTLLLQSILIYSQLIEGANFNDNIQIITIKAFVVEEEYFESLTTSFPTGSVQLILLLTVAHYTNYFITTEHWGSQRTFLRMLLKASLKSLESTGK